MTDKFPTQKYPNAGAFVVDYASAIAKALGSLRPGEVERAVTAMKRAIQSDRLIFTCGNGGSASISNHFVCDHTKGVRTDTDIKPCVHSLVSNVEIATAMVMGTPALVKEGLSWREVRLRAMHASPVELGPAQGFAPDVAPRQG